MDQVRSTLQAFLNLCLQVLALIFGWLTLLEVWLRGELTRLGVEGTLQTAVIVAVAVIFLIAAFRLAAGFLRIVLVLFFLLLAIHLILPFVHS